MSMYKDKLQLCNFLENHDTVYYTGSLPFNVEVSMDIVLQVKCFI